MGLSYALRIYLAQRGGSSAGKLSLVIPQYSQKYPGRAISPQPPGAGPHSLLIGEP
jgi:hypothetical protein